MCGTDCLLAIIAIFFPPLAVWVKRGLCSADSVINIALCVFGFIPGLIHAWYIISITPDNTYDELQEAEQGRTTYIVVQGGNAQRPRQAQPSYGSVNNNSVDAQFPGARSGFVQPQQGSSQGDAPPPSYQAAVGDNKVQRK
ncbi:hypothetical protein MRB53_041659 [Persea americana]|nr:hypothetical protein MRB53_041659 [Persea americana]